MRKSSVTSRSSFPSGAVVVPDDFRRLADSAFRAKVLAHHAMGGAEQVLEEIFMPLA